MNENAKNTKRPMIERSERIRRMTAIQNALEAIFEGFELEHDGSAKLSLASALIVGAAYGANRSAEEGLAVVRDMVARGVAEHARHERATTAAATVVDELLREVAKAAGVPSSSSAPGPNAPEAPAADSSPEAG
jgi:hypothetical protein